jgi:tetratricopeptide (TPR) repeat protein
MTQPANGNNGASQASSLTLTGGAAIVAPVQSFPNGIPGNALVVMPLSKPTDELVDKLQQGPVVITQEQMWQLLGFNGPAVQVQDDQGRPIAIGLEDLLAGLDKHWQEAPDDLNRARMYAQELLKYNRYEKAETVLAKIVAKGGLVGDDWLALGVTQMQLKKFDKAESTLKGAQNIMKTNPYPSLHLAKLYKQKNDEAAQRAMTLKAIDIEPDAVDAWGYLFFQVREKDGEEAAIKEIERIAGGEKNKGRAAPFIAIQGFYAEQEEGREQAIRWAKRAVETNNNDPLALLCLSALYRQNNQLDEVIRLLQPHEAKMARDVWLAHNYFEALFQSRQIDKVTKLLNALAGSQDREVKQFAIERSRAVAQFLQQQQQQLAQAAQQASNVSPPAPGGIARKG